MKKCYSCRKTKKLTEFYKNKARLDGYASQCKICNKKVALEFYKNNKKSRLKAFKIYRAKNKSKIKEQRLYKKYGLTLADVNSKLIEQDYKCLIGGEELDISTAKVDHCHKTGQVRGLLCSSCNVALGLLKDDIKALRKAIKYLTKRR